MTAADIQAAKLIFGECMRRIYPLSTAQPFRGELQRIEAAR